MFLVNVPDRYDAFIVIDGQHRLFSFSQDEYHKFEITKKDKESRLKKEDAEIKKLADELQLIVTAIYFKKPNNKIIDFSCRLFFEINTTQTRIKPEDVINLTVKLDPKNPTSKANVMLEKLNQKGALSGMIKTRFWQQDRIKITSLIRYGGIKDIFYEKSKTHKIFYNMFEKQTKIKDYVNFCYIIIENYLYTLKEAIKEKHGKKYKQMWSDVNLKEYYVTAAVCIGALLRLLRHFLSKEDQVFEIWKKITDTTFKGDIEKNINNQELMNMFKEPMKIIADSFKFNIGEFKKKGYAANRWAKVEADMYYSIQDRFKEKTFGNIKLIKKSLRKDE